MFIFLYGFLTLAGPDGVWLSNKKDSWKPRPEDALSVAMATGWHESVRQPNDKSMIELKPLPMKDPHVIVTDPDGVEKAPDENGDAGNHTTDDEIICEVME